MNRPAHADPTLWDYTGAGRDKHGQLQGWWLAIVSPYKPHPTAHRVVDGSSEPRHFVWWPACGSGTSFVEDSDLVNPRHAAQFALPCKRCWPGADPDATTERRYAKATA